jgi:hypothetical protein
MSKDLTTGLGEETNLPDLDDLLDPADTVAIEDEEELPGIEQEQSGQSGGHLEIVH